MTDPTLRRLAAGLSKTLLKPGALSKAILAGRPVRWKNPTSKQRGAADPSTLIGELKKVDADKPLAGQLLNRELRLLVDLGDYKAAAALVSVLRTPGDPAFNRIKGIVLVNGGGQPPSSFVPHWPLSVVAPPSWDNSGRWFDRFAFLAPRPENGGVELRLSADGKTLTVTLFQTRVGETEPRRAGQIIAPLKQVSAAEWFDNWLYHLSHDLPVDAAAWEARRSYSDRPAGPPMVIGPRGGFSRSRLSGFVPVLRKRLRSWRPAAVVATNDWSEGGVAGFGPVTQNLPHSASVTVKDLRKWLKVPSELAWDEEADSATALANVAKISPARDDITVAEAAESGGVLLGIEVDPAADTITPIPRFTDVQVSDEHGPLSKENALQPGQTYTLEVAIRSAPTGWHTTEAIASPEIDADALLIVAVTDESSSGGKAVEAVALATRMGKLILPRRGDTQKPASFAFELIPSVAAVGTVRLGIRLFHRLDLVDHVLLEIPVGEATDQNRWSIASARAEKDAMAINTSAPPRGLNVSIASWNDGYLEIAFARAKKRGGERPIWLGQARIQEAELTSCLANLRGVLLDLVLGAALDRGELTKSELKHTLKGLAEHGSNLVSRLFDRTNRRGDLSTIADWIRDLGGEEGLRVQISYGPGAQNLVFPWQLLTTRVILPEDKVSEADFWGFRFAIEQKSGFSRPPAKAAPVTPRISYARWNGFSNAAAHKSAIDKILAARWAGLPDTYQVFDDRNTLLSSLAAGGGELVYVFAHGSAATPNSPEGLRWQENLHMEIAKREAKNDARAAGAGQQMLAIMGIGPNATPWLELTDSRITLPHLQEYELDGEPIELGDGPIVILNTCESAQNWPGVTDTIARFFLVRGAAAVVGTEATIPIVAADLFGQLLLSALVTDGLPLGKALLEARKSMLALNNPLGLCYTIYGSADAQLVQQEGTA